MMMGGGLILLIALAVLVVFLVQGGLGPRSQGEEPRTGAGAGDILAERFARGEISTEEFEERRKALERQPS